jgi:nucleoside-diphosphate-sugar epimerase
MRHVVKSALVTGGAGFLGAAVARRLHAEGMRVRVLDDLSHGRKERLHEDIELAIGDVRSARVVREACEGIDAVVHLATAQPFDHSSHAERVAHDVNVTGVVNTLLAAREAGVCRFVYSSSHNVYGGRIPYLLHEDIAPQPHTLEGAQQVAAEAYVRLFTGRDGSQATILRFFEVYGPGQEEGFIARLVEAAFAREPAVLRGDGNQTRDLVYVEDAAAAVAASLLAPAACGRTLNIGSGESVAVRTVAAMLSELMGGLPPPRYAAAVPGEPRDIRASVAAAASTLGFRTRTRIREGLAACLGMVELAAPPLPMRAVAPPPARAASVPPPPVPAPAFPEGSDTKLPALGAPIVVPAAPLFSDRPPSWTVTDETEISLGMAIESTREWST